MKQSLLVRALFNLDKLELGDDRVLFKTAILAHELGFKYTIYNSKL